MEDHVKILGIVRIVFGALGLVGALVVLAVFGGAAGILGLVAASEEPDAAFAVPLLGLLGTMLFLLITVLSLPGIIAGVGILKYRPWGRILGIIVSALDLLNFPIGTAIGVYGLWVLFQKETESLFERGGFVSTPR
jgi:hypothetical protein